MSDQRQPDSLNKAIKKGKLNFITDQFSQTTDGDRGNNQAFCLTQGGSARQGHSAAEAEDQQGHQRGLCFNRRRQTEHFQAKSRRDRAQEARARRAGHELVPCIHF